jgi:hypothetical protein
MDEWLEELEEKAKGWEFDQWMEDI